MTNGPQENLFFFSFLKREGLEELNGKLNCHGLGFSSKTQCWQYRAGTNGSEKSTEHGVLLEEMVSCYGGVLLLLQSFFRKSLSIKKKLQKDGFRHIRYEGNLGFQIL